MYWFMATLNPTRVDANRDPQKLPVVNTTREFSGSTCSFVASLEEAIGNVMHALTKSVKFCEIQSKTGTVSKGGWRSTHKHSIKTNKNQLNQPFGKGGTAGLQQLQTSVCTVWLVNGMCSDIGAK